MPEASKHQTTCDMKTRTSETTFNGETVKVQHTEPTLEDIRKKLSDERIAKMIVDTLNRHHFLPTIRDAGAVIGGEFKSKTEEGKKREQERAVKIAEQVDEEHVFDILEFIPDERVSVDAELKPYMAAAKDAIAKAQAAGKTVTMSVEDIAREIKKRAEAAASTIPGL